MTAPVNEKATAEFDLVIGDLELEIPALDETTASTTHLGTGGGNCFDCTCAGIYCS
ncbi:hypothetical protein [Fodinicola feengrottensis]|nr:hypothetical protein [Fodinicola feengrottensis]